MMEGWQCPKCTRCYSPMVRECRVCNIRIEDEEQQQSWKEMEDRPVDYPSETEYIPQKNRAI